MCSTVRIAVGLWLMALVIPASAAMDPCSLLTQAQVSEALGTNVAPGKRVVPTLCDWSAAATQPGTRAKKVTLTLKKPQEFAYLKMPVGNGITKTPVSGIGDEAVYGTTPGYATTLSVRKGDNVFVIPLPTGILR